MKFSLWLEWLHVNKDILFLSWISPEIQLRIQIHPVMHYTTRECAVISNENRVIKKETEENVTNKHKKPPLEGSQNDMDQYDGFHRLYYRACVV